MPQPRAGRVEAQAPSGGGARRRPFRRSRWVEVDRVDGSRLVVGGLVARLIELGWAEADGNGRVRLTEVLPAVVAEALGPGSVV